MLTSIVGSEIVHLPGEEFYDTEIRAKPFNVLQAKTMQRLSMTADVNGIIKLIGECISYDVNQLFTSDFKYLLHWFRINSYKDFPRYISWDCPHCQLVNETAITSDNLRYTEVPSELVNGGLNMMFDNFPEGLFVRAQKISDEKFASDLKKENRISEDNIEVTNIIMNLNLLRNPQNKLSMEDLWKLYKDNKFTNDDMMALDMFREEYDWGVKDSYALKCSHCNEVVNVESPFNITEFFQVDGSKRSLRKRILPNVPTQSTDNIDREDGVEGVLMDVRETLEDLRRIEAETGAGSGDAGVS